jgi:hypothetical protein
VKPWASFTTRGNGWTAPTCGAAKANTDTLGGRLCLCRVARESERRRGDVSEPMWWLWRAKSKPVAQNPLTQVTGDGTGRYTGLCRVEELQRLYVRLDVLQTVRALMSVVVTAVQCTRCHCYSRPPHNCGCVNSGRWSAKLRNAGESAHYGGRQTMSQEEQVKEKKHT